MCVLISSKVSLSGICESFRGFLKISHLKSSYFDHSSDVIGDLIIVTNSICLDLPKPDNDQKAFP